MGAEQAQAVIVEFLERSNKGQVDLTPDTDHPEDWVAFVTFLVTAVVAFGIVAITAATGLAHLRIATTS